MRAMIAIALVVLVGCTSLAGCASLIANPYDSTLVRVHKRVARIWLAPLTLGTSERIIRRIIRRRHELRVLEAFLDEMSRARTIIEITNVLGPAPKSCLDSRPGFQLCTWEVGKTQTGYRIYHGWYQSVMAPYTYGAVLTTVCEVTTDGSPRQPESCRISMPRGAHYRR